MRFSMPVCMACFGRRLVDFEAIELSLREPGLEKRLSELPLVERVVLRDVRDMVRAIMRTGWMRFGCCHRVSSASCR